MPTRTELVPEYAATVADCGDPQPVIDEVTEQLDAQSPPEIITTSVVINQGNEDEPDPEDEPAESDEDKTEDGHDA